LFKDNDLCFSETKPIKCEVSFYRAVITETNLDPIIDEIDKNNQISLQHLCLKTATKGVISHRKVIQLDSGTSQIQARSLVPAPESINYTTSLVEVYYTESQAKLIGLLSEWSYSQNEFFQTRILAELQRQTGLSFETAYRLRLGCFEVYRASQQQQFPFVQKTESGIEIHPTKNKNDSTCSMHIVLREGEETIFDSLIKYDPNNVVYLTVTESFNNIENTYFDADGHLLHKEHHNYLEQIAINMQIRSGGAKRIEDDLTLYLENRKQPESQKAAVVDVGISSHPMVVKYDKSAFKQNKLALEDHFYKRNSSLKGNFFEQTDDKGKAYSWLIDFINSSKSIWIIDPYLSSATVIQAFRRINHEVQVKAITSLGKGAADASIRLELETSLSEYGKDIQCKLEIINLTKNDNGKLFHDRFLIRFDSARPEAFILSNSLSTYGENFPFTVMQLDWETADKVISYFKEVISDNKIDKKALWNSLNFHEQAKSKINDNWLLNSSFFQFGLDLILGRKFDLVDLASKIEVGKYDEGDFILRKRDSVGFDVDLGLFQSLLQENVLLKNVNEFSIDQIASILVVFGELAARCSADELETKLAAWLVNLSEKESLNKALKAIVMFYNKNTLFVAQHSTDISYPKITSLTGLFDLAESMVQAPYEIRGRYYGLAKSAELIVSIIPLQVELSALQQEENILKNILRGIIEALGFSQTTPGEAIVHNLLQSDLPIFKAISCCHLIQADCTLEKLIALMRQCGISNELIILTLVRKYKSLMHNYYRIKDMNGVDLDGLLQKMDSISKEACKIWEQTEVSDHYLDAIYESFFEKFSFACKFVAPLSNQQQKKKFCQRLIDRLEAKYGWLEKAESKSYVFANENDLEMIIWAAKAYQICYSDQILEKIGKWDKKFGDFAKNILKKPLYKGDATNLCDRLAILYYFVSEVVLEIIAKGHQKQTLEKLINSLIAESTLMFGYENCRFGAINKFYHQLSFNLAKICVLNGKSLTNAEIGNEYPLSNYLLAVSGDEVTSEIAQTKIKDFFDFEEKDFAASWVTNILLLFLLRAKVPDEFTSEYFVALNKFGLDQDTIRQIPVKLSEVIQGKLEQYKIQFGTVQCVFKIEINC